jgi:O-antigen/teichoic acid export membrane protein
MGVYSAAGQWFRAIIFFPAILCQAFMPVLSERLGARAGAQSRRITAYTVLLIGAVVVPAGVVLCLCGRFIMGLYGPAFAAEWPTFAIVIATAVVVALLTPAGYAIAASGRMWTNLVMTLGWGAVLIVATRYLVVLGAVGVGTARLIAYLLHGAWTFAFVTGLLRGGDAPGDTRGDARNGGVS